MRKYIILFLFICSVSNAQYNLFARQNFNYKTVSTGTNTEIGGVASTISTPALLATKLGIDVSRISNFAIVGSDIKCRITGLYDIPDSGGTLTPGFGGNTNITYFYDKDNLQRNLYNYTFWNCPNLTRLELLGLTYIKTTSFRTSPVYDLNFPNLITLLGIPTVSNTLHLYIPVCTELGATSGNDGVLTGIVSGSHIYANPYLATNNAGSPDGDLTYAISQGAIVRYVTNYTAPNPVTTLAAGTIYNSSIQLNFTAPTGSTNAIEYYDCYANGVLKNRITASGQYITDLVQNTNYDITVKAVDIFYNKSIVSNNVNTTTTNISFTETNTYETRVLADSGVLISKSYINDEYNKMYLAGVNGDLRFWHNYKSGMKKDGSNLVEKMYSFIGSNTDIVQTTTANKPKYTTTGIIFDVTDLLTKTLSTSITDKSFSVVWRLKSTPGDYYPQISLSPGAWTGFQMHSASGGLIYAGITVANRFALAGGSFLTNTDATYTFTYNSVSKVAKIYRNTVLLSTKTMVDPADFTTLSIDAQGGIFYDSKMFSKDLSLTEITNIL